MSVPRDIPDEIAEACKAIALEAHRLLGCKGASRSDFRWDDERGVDGLFLLEVNTQPGMTPLSLVPEQARHIGMSYPELVQAIVDEALRRDRRHEPDDQARHRRRERPRRAASGAVKKVVADRPADRARCRSARRRCARSRPGDRSARGGAVRDRGGDLARRARHDRRRGRRGRRARAGFRVEQIEVTGPEAHGPDDASMRSRSTSRSRAMPLVDLDAVREKLLRYGWIADAHVSRRLPDTLLVDIVERDAGGGVAGQWPADADRRDGRAARAGRSPTRCPTCRW